MYNSPGGGHDLKEQWLDDNWLKFQVEISSGSRVPIVALKSSGSGRRVKSQKVGNSSKQVHNSHGGGHDLKEQWLDDNWLKFQVEISSGSRAPIVALKSSGNGRRVKSQKVGNSSKQVYNSPGRGHDLKEPCLDDNWLKFQVEISSGSRAPIVALKSSGNGRRVKSQKVGNSSKQVYNSPGGGHDVKEQCLDDNWLKFQVEISSGSRVPIVALKSSGNGRRVKSQKVGNSSKQVYNSPGRGHDLKEQCLDDNWLKFEVQISSGSRAPIVALKSSGNGRRVKSQKVGNFQNRCIIAPAVATT